MNRNHLPGAGVLGLLTLGANGQSLGEFTGAELAVGRAPCDVIAVDLDGDGAPDLATADSGSDTVTVLYIDGSGAQSGTATVALAAGSTPTALASGDLAPGGGRDLAVAALDGDAVILVDNDGAGTFVVSAVLSTLPATEPVDVALGDINGSGLDDLVVAMQGDVLVPGTGSVAVSVDGGPLLALTAPPGGFARPQRVVLRDLDGDGDDDVAVTMAGGGFSPTVTDNVLLYENVGGTFAAPITLSVLQNPRGIACADLDYDGDLDLAVTAEGSPFLLPGSVEVFDNVDLAAGDWQPSDFASGGSFTAGVLPTALAAADLRDDSIPGHCALHDLVAVNFASETLTRFDGYDPIADAFAAQATWTAGAVPVAVAIADFDGNRTPDLAIASKGGDSVHLLMAANPAFTKVFGSGCPGTAGLVPQIAAVGLPRYGASFGAGLSSARPSALAIYALSLRQGTSAFGPCELYLGPPFFTGLTPTGPAGDAKVRLGIPPAGAGFDGVEVFCQFGVLDPNGAFAGVLAFSDALRAKIGS